jgi:hypothetical protein
MSAVPTCQPHNNAYFLFLFFNFFVRRGAAATAPSWWVDVNENLSAEIEERRIRAQPRPPSRRPSRTSVVPPRPCPPPTPQARQPHRQGRGLRPIPRPVQQVFVSVVHDSFCFRRFFLLGTCIQRGGAGNR